MNITSIIKAYRLKLLTLTYKWTRRVSFYFINNLVQFFKSFLRKSAYVYVCPTSAHRGFRYGYRRYKDNTFTLRTALFGRKSMILRSDLTLLNINISKNSTFA